MSEDQKQDFPLVEMLLNAKIFSSAAEIARAVGVSEQAVSEAKKRKANPAKWHIPLILTRGINPVWLETGRGLPIAPRDDAVYLDVPRVQARLSAGTGSLMNDGEVVGFYKFRLDWLTRVARDPNKLVLMTAQGDSMEPVIPDKSMVLVDQGNQELVTGKTFAVGVDEEIMVKRIEKQPGVVVLKSWNPAYSDMPIDMNDESKCSSFRVIGRVVWMGTAM